MAKKHSHPGLGHVGKRGELGDAGTWNCPDGCGDPIADSGLTGRFLGAVGLGKAAEESESVAGGGAGDDDSDDDTE